MSDATRDRIEGSVDDAKGRGKAAWGNVTDDEDKQAEGQLDQTKGEAKQGMADVKDKVDDVVKKVTDR
jgi:uncharacterized protein YjbJ (UPF0337 family)